MSLGFLPRYLPIERNALCFLNGVSRSDHHQLRTYPFRTFESFPMLTDCVGRLCLASLARARRLAAQVHSVARIRLRRYRIRRNENTLLQTSCLVPAAHRVRLSRAIRGTQRCRVRPSPRREAAARRAYSGWAWPFPRSDPRSRRRLDRGRQAAVHYLFIRATGGRQLHLDQHQLPARAEIYVPRPG